MMGYYGSWGWMGFVGTLAMLAFWVALIVLVVWAVRGFSAGGRNDNSPTALEIVQRRFAAGEITREEYEQARRTLGGPLSEAR
jgi:putative membrane protein